MGKYPTKEDMKLSSLVGMEHIMLKHIANELAENNRLKILNLRMRIYENENTQYSNDILTDLEDRA